MLYIHSCTRLELQDELGPPALAFVRTICAVLALDSALDEEVAVLRRNLLKLVHVREFASASEFKEPCMSYVLRDVICPSCNDCRDLDLCRDPHLQVSCTHPPPLTLGLSPFQNASLPESPLLLAKVVHSCEWPHYTASLAVSVSNWRTCASSSSTLA